MKKSKWLLLALIVLSVLALVGYRAWDRTVTDSVPPQITVEEGTLQLSVLSERSGLLQGVSARDARDGDVTGSLIVERVGGITADGQATVWYAAFDRSGNVAKASRTVQYTDYEQPRFCLTGPLLFPAGSTFDVLDVMRADDLLDGNISHRVRATSLSEQALSGPGTYGVLFQVSNSLGDTCSLTLNAELYPTGSYNADLKLTDYLIYLPVGSSFDPEDYLLSFRHSVKPVELRRGVPEEYQLDITGTVDTDTPGVYEVDYVLSYEPGAQIYVGRSRLAVVVEE